MKFINHIQLSELQREELAAYLGEEIPKAMNERQGFIDQVDRQEVAYSGKPDTAVKDFPFPGASNVVIPRIGINTDAYLARVFKMIFQFGDVAVAKAYVPELEEFMAPLQKYINWCLRRDMDFQAVCIPVLISTFKHGNGFLEMPWRQAKRTYFNPQTEKKEEDQEQDGPNPTPKRIQDILVPSSALDIQSAKWVSSISHLQLDDLLLAEKEGVLQPPKGGSFKDIVGFPSATPAEGQERVDYLNKINKIRTEEYHIHRVQLRWDIDNDGRPEDICVILNQEDINPDKLLAVYWHPYVHGQRDIVHFKMFPKDFSFYASGIAEYLQSLQEEETTMHRQSVDAATLDNVRLLGAKRGSNVKNLKQVWTSRVVQLDNPKEDLVPIALGGGGNSSLALNRESVVRSVADERCGTTQQSIGKAPRRETASTNTSLLQQAGIRFDFTTMLVRGSISESLMQMTQLYQQFKPMVSYYVPQKGEGGMTNLVPEKMNLVPLGKLRGRIGFEVISSGDTMNKEIQRQQNLTLVQMMTVFFQKMIELATMISNPMLPPPIRKYAESVAGAAQEMMDRILKDFDIYDNTKLLPDLLAIVNVDTEPFNLNGGMDPNGNGSQIPAGNGSGSNGGDAVNTGLEALLSSYTGASASGPGGASGG